MKFDIERLVEIIRNARISELHVEAGDTSVRLRKPLRPSQVVSTNPSQTPACETTTPIPDEPTDVYIVAPMVGIYHSADSIGTGSVIRTGQIVGMIESMKLMNDMIADKEGVVSEVLIEDGMPVEYGQNLFKLEKLT